MTPPQRPVSRRSVLGHSLTAAGMGIVGDRLPADPSPSFSAEQSVIAPDSVVLFQGDSITDSSRERIAEARANDPAALGDGYAWLAAAGLLVGPTGRGLEIHNRGISGHRVPDLDARWERDCLALQPDVLSILVGVNDLWHKRNGNYHGTAESYAAGYDRLLERTRAALPDVRLVLCEPFVLRCGAVDDSWFPEFDDYRAGARGVAQKHDATWVAFHSMFARASEIAPPATWAEDGVHPTPAGAALMAQTWLRTVAGL